MISRVNSYNVKQGKAVTLSKDLPTGHSFGNHYSIKEGSKGYVLGDGFVTGRLKVEFWTHVSGKQIVEFNTESAANYLTTDF
jgi:hypothetical protein